MILPLLPYYMGTAMKRYQKITMTFLLLIICNLCDFFSNKYSLYANKLLTWAYLETRYSDILDQPYYLERICHRYDILSFTGYLMDKNGQLYSSLSKKKEKQISDLIKLHGKRLYPLIGIRSVKDGMALLKSRDNMLIAARNINRFLLHHSLSGVHLAIAYLPYSMSQGSSVFLGMLKKELKGKTLSMAVSPPAYFPQTWSAFHDLKAITPYLDEIVIMCYDYHRPGTKPGPVVDISWSEKNIKKVQEFMPAGRIWLGVPAYGYAWNESGKASAISAKRGVLLGKQHKGIRHSSGTLYFSYTRNKVKYMVYLSDKTTLSMMEALAEKYHLKGTSLWRLGFEE